MPKKSTIPLRFIEYLQCVSHCPGYQEQKKPCSQVAYSPMEDTEK